MRRRNLKQFPFMLIVAIFCFFIPSCAEQPSPSNTSNPESNGTEAPLKKIENPHYGILPGDEIEIKLPYHPQYNERLEVLPDGSIFLPIVDVVQAADKTPVELAKELNFLYAKELKDPNVIVMLRSSKGRFVYVGGEVKIPQALPLMFPITLLQAIIRCGDILSSAHQSSVLVLRASPGGTPQAIKADLSAIRQGKSADLVLEPYDIVFIPKTAINKLNEFIEEYLNRIIPRAVTFPFTYEIRSDLKN